MGKFCLTIFIQVFLLVASHAQFAVRLKINDLPKEPRRFDLYIAGSFNGWNPQSENYIFQREGNGEYYIELELPAGTYEYKITRGGWDKVECKKDGAGKENRRMVISADTIIKLDIEEWQDHFATKPGTSTAGKNVKIIDTAFLIPQLNRVRRVWIYLPRFYDMAPQNSRWPVLYMHDGQNVFDDATSFSGEWGVDEFFDTAYARPWIVVAIDNGAGKRINEYCPYDFSLKTLGLSSADTLNKGEGDQYVDFLVKTLKPFIDKNYRTLKDKKNTFIAGSSMGGLISLYAVLKYPKVFGGAGVFSPAFWVAPKIFDDIKEKGEKVKANIYFYAGKQEGETMVPLTLKAFDEMLKVSKSKMKTVIRDEGKHNEQRWRIEFPSGFYWMVEPNSTKPGKTYTGPK
ncbi:MAG: alpha/beta hydrolase [Chitinophagaceae bacterium]|nr:alpha/beta hydrolase [Chitinophagaceae bacterium]